LDIEEFYLLYNYYTEFLDPVREYFQAHFASILRESRQYEEKQSMKEEECCICLDNPVNLVLDCSHGFCEDCISDWQKQQKSCPVCRYQSSEAGSPDAWIIAEKYLSLANSDGDGGGNLRNDYEQMVLKYPFEYLSSKNDFTQSLRLNTASRLFSNVHLRS
jgi:hypothetical protein